MAKRGPKFRTPEEIQAMVLPRFEKIKELMEMGYPRTAACKSIKISTNWLYTNFSPAQMQEIDQIYYSHLSGASATRKSRL